MAGGVPAGRLSIEIIAEIARLQQDMDRVRSLVKSASSDIARNAKYANDNLAAVGKGSSAGIQEFSREVARIKSNLDPAWAAAQKYRGEIALLRQALNEGAITHKVFVDQVRAAAAAYQQAGKATESVRGPSKLAGHQVQNLAFQFQDLGVQMAMAAQSSAPLKMALMALFQQGSQISGIMGQAGLSVKGLAVEVGGMVGRFATAHPYLTAFTAAAGIATAGMAVFTSQLNTERKGELDAYRASLGLTKDELEKLGPASITAGDAMVGLGRTIQQVLGIDASKIVDSFKSYMLRGVEAVWNGFKIANAAIYAAFTGTFNGVKAAWSHLPDALGEAAVGAANMVIRALNFILSKGAEYINKFSGLVNSIMAKIPGMGGMKLGTVSAPQIEALANPFTGGGKRAGGAFIGGITAAFNESMAAQGTLGKMLADNIVSATKDRLGDKAQDLIGDRAEKAGRSAGQKAGKAMKDEMAKFTEEMVRDLAATLGRLSVDFAKLRNNAWDTDWTKLLGDASKAVGPSDDQIKRLNDFTEAMQKLRDLAPEIRFGDVFGDFGNGIDRAIAALKRFEEAEQQYSIARQAIGDNDPDRIKKLTELEQGRGKAKVSATMSMLGASKQFFNHESGMYKAITAAEKALAAIQMINTIRSIAMDTMKTTSSVANAGARTAADTAAGGAKMFSFLGPFAFPVVAAMIAVMASLGFKSGTSSAPSIPTAEELQETAGTGSILGDSKAKSNSIANSLEIVASNTNKDLEYTNHMLQSLRSIDTGISKLAGSVAKQIQVSGGMFDTSGANLGSSGSNGFLGLFGSSTTRSLWDVGIDLASATVGNIIVKGITGNTYQIVQQIKKTSGFFGIGGGTKTTYQTTTGQIDPAITAAIGDVMASLREGLLAASSVIGKDGAAALIDGFQVNLGRISFKDMTGQEIEDQLNAIFSKVGDDLAGAVFPELRTMQKIGEGLFETFMRIAREYQVVDTALKSIGMTFGAVGVSSVAARDNLVQLFGSLDDFVNATDFYRENFLSEAEQIAPIFASVTAEMARLGLASVDTIAEFKGVVSGLDLTTQAGRDMFAALMKVAPAFNAVEKYQDKLAKQYTDQADALKAYRDELTGAGSAGSFAALSAKFRTTAASAAMGDLTAMGDLKSAASKFLDAAKAGAGSALDFARARAEVINSVDESIFAAETLADYAQLQVDAIGNTNAILADVRQQLAAQGQMLMSIASSGAASQRALERLDDNGIQINSETPVAVTVS